MRVLALSPVPEEGAGCRFRISQYVPHLAEQGIEVVVSPFLTREFFDLAYRPGHYVRKTALFLRRTLARIDSVLRDRSSDVLFLYREAFPVGPPFFERLLAGPGRPPIVYDFDDAVFLSNTSHANRAISFLKHPEKIANILRWSTAVIAGNQYLADYASRHNRHVSIVPTSVDTTKFAPARPASDASRDLVCGWIGSPTTTKYLEALAPVLSRIARSRPFELRVAGASHALQVDGVPVTNMRWSLADEVSLFNTCDIGLYPLPDDDWTRGKCGFKAIQFMACGVPVVAAAVGVNKEIIRDGVNGFLASTEDEWVEKITRLAGDADLRRRIGEAGRCTVEREYSVAVNAPRVAAVLHQAVERAGEGAPLLSRSLRS